MSQLTTADIGADFLPVQLPDIESAAGTSAEHECLLSVAEHAIKQLITKHIFRRLIQLAYPAFVDLALVDLSVMLPFRDDQKAFIESLGLEVLCNHKGIANMCLDDVFLLAPIFRYIAIRSTNFNIRKHSF